MPNSGNSTNQPITDDAQLTSAGGEAAVDQPALTLAELNQVLGKDFKDVPTAMKALKDTQSYVGKKKEDIAAEVRAQLAGSSQNASASPSLESEVRSLQEQVFYANNPQFKGHETVIKAMGSNPAEVVESEAFKIYFEKATVAGEVASKKSVVASNPRLAQTKTVTEEAVRVANTTGSSTATADVLAQAIREEIES